MSEVEKIALSRTQRWLRLALGGGALLLVALVALPIGLRYGAEYWLNEQPHMSAHIGDVDLNLFTGRIQVEDLELEHLTKPVLVARKAVVKINWLPLLQKRIYVEQIILETGLLWLTQEQNEPLVVAGFPLVSEPSEPPPVLDPPTQASGESWDVHSGKILLNAFRVRYQAPNIDVDATIDQLDVDPLISWQPEAVTPFRSNMVVNGGSVNLDGTLSPFSSRTVVDSSLHIAEFELQRIAPLLTLAGITDASGRVDCDVQLKVEKSDDASQTMQLGVAGELTATDFQGGTLPLFIHHLSSQWAGTVSYTFSHTPQLALEGTFICRDIDIDLLEAGLNVEQKSLSWQGTTGFSEGLLTLAGDIHVAEHALEDLEKQRQLLSLEQLDLNGVTITGVENIASSDIRLHGLQLFERNEEADSSHSVTVAKTSLLDVTLHNLNQLHVEKFHLTGAQIGLKRTSSGAFDLQEWFVPSATATDDVAVPQTADGQPSFAVQCNELLVDGSSQVRLIDSTVQPAVPIVLNDIELQLAHIDSAKPQQLTPLTFTSRVGRYSKFNIGGTVQPFLQPLGLDLKGALQEFNVADISPYSEKSIGYQLHQGQLNLDFTLPIANGMMALESDLYLKQFRLQALSAADEARASKGIGLPVNLALSLLRDRDGDIHIQLPVEGDLNDPNLHIGPILRSAVLHTLHNTVMLPLAPLGIVSKAGKVIGLGQALSFERVAFEPGTAVMPQTSLDYLQNVETLLSERSGLSVAVCGCFSEQDQQLIASQEKDITRQQAAYRELADARSVAVKEELLRRGQVKAAQLLLCRPSSTVDLGVSGVDLTLQ